MAVVTGGPTDPAVIEFSDHHAASLIALQDRRIARRTDRMFGAVLLLQAILAVGMALWAGRGAREAIIAQSTGVWLIVALIGLLSAPALLLIHSRPGAGLTRHVVAVAQMSTSALLFQICDGRLQTDVHIVASLAFLASYRDWTVIVTATAALYVDQAAWSALRPGGVVWPAGTGALAWAERVGWILFIDVFLVASIARGRREIRSLVTQVARTSAGSLMTENEIQARTLDLKAAEERFTALARLPALALLQTDADGRCVFTSSQWESVTGTPPASVLGETWTGLVSAEERADVAERWGRAVAGRDPFTREFTVSPPDEGTRWLYMRMGPLPDENGRFFGHVGTVEDVTQRKHLELELRQAQKLEAVGRLAAGIAHEINTPIQFISDSVYFMKEAFQDLVASVTRYRAVLSAAEQGPVEPLLLAEARGQEVQADVAYLLEHVPRAIERTMDGAARVAHIVRAMKDFAHPDRGEKSAADLNQALLSTLTVAHNELRYVAEVQTDLGELPPVHCHLGDLNQVFLNLLVNAAHAIGESRREGDPRGTIRVRTRAEEGHVTISISDTGTGIPESARPRIFEPFFTTKEVGRGTGQGLAIARSIVVDKHSGALTFETEVGRGTTFHVRIPVDPAFAAGRQDS